VRKIDEREVKGKSSAAAATGPDVGSRPGTFQYVANLAVMIISTLARRGLSGRRIAGYAAAGALAMFFLTKFLLWIHFQAFALFLLDEEGYGDSYILYDVWHFQSTGVIYPDLSQPPYLPAQYSPLVYILYALPGLVMDFENPFLGPRFIALAAFISCIVVVVSIVRTLIPARWAWFWGLLLTTSSFIMQNWILQLRGDMQGSFFDLLALRLLLGRFRHNVLLAGLCAGFAAQFKITFVTALAAGFIWLFFRKRWRELVGFTAAGTLTSAGLYLFFWAWQPRMFDQILALSPGIKDVRGCVVLISQAVKEPVVVLALLGFPPMLSRSRPRWGLVVVFVLVSSVIASVADIQAGGNVNYFFETLFALTPAAVLGVYRLTHWPQRDIRVAVFVPALVMIYLLQPNIVALYRTFFSGRNDVEISNGVFRTVQHALQGRHIFSTVPRLALLDRHPALIEPFLLSYLQRLGKVDSYPVIERIRGYEFDVVITTAAKESWRGIPVIPDDLHRAIEGSYKPECTMHGRWLVHLPRNRSENRAFEQELNQVGCLPFRVDHISAGSTW
jgi:hypothetical protein